MADNAGLLTFGGHLDVLRKMLFRILIVVGTFAVIIFCLKDWTWQMLLAPSEWDFCTYKGIENLAHYVGLSDFRFEPYSVDLIATDLSSQLYELFKFTSPALYENERKYSTWGLIIVYFLFVVGILMSYYILFPISFRFLGTYSVADKVHSTITLDSYVSTFTTLTLMMGVVFQLPVIAFALTKLGFINSQMLSKYRKQAFLIIMIVAAIITPPDLMTLIMVTIPLYLLYEVSIRVAKWQE